MPLFDDEVEDIREQLLVMKNEYNSAIIGELLRKLNDSLDKKVSSDEAFNTKVNGLLENLFKQIKVIVSTMSLIDKQDNKDIVLKNIDVLHKLLSDNVRSSDNIAVAINNRPVEWEHTFVYGGNNKVQKVLSKAK